MNENLSLLYAKPVDNVQQTGGSSKPNINAINLSNIPNTHTQTTVSTTKPAVVNQTHEPSIPAAYFSASSSYNNNNVVPNEPTKQLPYVASNIDDFINNNTKLQSPRERKTSNSSVENDDNYDYEPYTRRDYRTDLKSDKILNDTSSGYFTSPNENEKPLRAENVFSPESSDYEKFEYQKNIAKNREEYSSSPVDSQSGRSISSHRKSVSFDLDVEEYSTEYNPEDEVEKLRIQKLNDEDVFYEKSHYHHHQLQPEPKRIKGILRSPSPSVYYKGNVSSKVAVEKEYIDDDDDEEIEKENPFRKEYISHEKLNALEYDPSTTQSVISESAQSDVRSQITTRSNENLQSKIPIKKPIFKSSGSLVDRPKLPPPRPPQPNIKVAEMVKNEGLERMSQQMEQKDFLEFVHNAETNTIEAVMGQELFDPDDPLPPLPKCPPPPLHFKRANSLERPKASPPPPPTPKTPKPAEDILEILPARFDTLPTKQKPHFVNENSQNNILVTEDEHREILLTENELRNAMQTEYDEKKSSNAETLIEHFSSKNPFLDDSSSFDSSSFQSTPNILSPVSTLDKSGSSFGQYTPSYQQTSQHVQPINIFPPPTQVLPVHYGQLPKPQQAGYYPLMSHQYPIHYNAPSTGLLSPTLPNQTYVQQQSFSQSPYGIEQQHQQQQRTYLVSGDGQNNFYVNHNVNNTANNQQQHQTLLMQSAYGPLSQPSPPNQTSLQQMHLHLQASHSQYVASTPRNNNQPQFIYEHQQQHPQQQQQQQFYEYNLLNNNVQYAQTQQQTLMDSVSELSPIRINPVPQNFIYPSSTQSEQKPTMSSFGKQTEV